MKHMLHLFLQKENLKNYKCQMNISILNGLLEVRISEPTTWSVRLIRIVDSNSLCYSLYMYIGDFHLGAVLHPRGSLAICGDIFGCHNWG